MLYIVQKDSDLKTVVRPASDNLQITAGGTLAEPTSNILMYSQSVYLIHPKWKKKYALSPQTLIRPAVRDSIVVKC